MPLGQLVHCEQVPREVQRALLRHSNPVTLEHGTPYLKKGERENVFSCCRNADIPVIQLNIFAKMETKSELFLIKKLLSLFRRDKFSSLYFSVTELLRILTHSRTVFLSLFLSHAHSHAHAHTHSHSHSRTPTHRHNSLYPISVILILYLSKGQNIHNLDVSHIWHAAPGENSFSDCHLPNKREFQAFTAKIGGKRESNLGLLGHQQSRLTT